MTFRYYSPRGFTLIELIIFIIVIGLLATTLLLVMNIALQSSPTLHRQLIANQTARMCMEWIVGQRQLNGYDSLPCDSSTVPVFCSENAPNGYVLAVDTSCPVIAGDSHYKTLTVTVTGLSRVSLSTLIAAY